MRKLDEVASSIGHDAKTNKYQRARRIPISFMKLKVLMSSKEESANKLQSSEIRTNFVETVERPLNQQGNGNRSMKYTYIVKIHLIFSISVMFYYPNCSFFIIK